MANYNTTEIILSKLFTRMWKLDSNKCVLDVDYSIDLQERVTSTDVTSKDNSNRKFFSMFNEQKIFEKSTYKAFRALLDNYVSSTNEEEIISREEEDENWKFLDLICNTDVMNEAYNFLLLNKKVSNDKNEFKRILYNIWFKIYYRTNNDTVLNSCGFEHVFVGETRYGSVIGLHNWIQFYLQEKIGNIDYRGVFSYETSKDINNPLRIVTTQFIWKKKAKPLCGYFIGTSPEFEVAIYTVLFLTNIEKIKVDIDSHDVELICHRNENGIGSAYPAYNAL